MLNEILQLCIDKGIAFTINEKTSLLSVFEKQGEYLLSLGSAYFTDDKKNTSNGNLIMPLEDLKIKIKNF